MSQPLPPLPLHFEYRLDLAHHVTPRLIKDQPVHRWFYFPHSYSPQLVDMLLDEWRLGPGTAVLDPFVGAGTTLRVAGERGINAVGADVSPLSVVVSNAKVGQYDVGQVRKALQDVVTEAHDMDSPDLSRTERLERAFTDSEFDVLLRLRSAISRQADCVGPLFVLALLRVQQRVSRAQPDGGWFRWVERDSQTETITPDFMGSVERMLADVEDVARISATVCEAHQHDARQLEHLGERLPNREGHFQAIITSPPYPNRHDYSRIFQIELLTLGLSESDVFDLRRNSIRSHVEAHAPVNAPIGFNPPARLLDTLSQLPDKTDRRIEPMLCGYFEDMHAVMESAFRVLAPGGRMALVVGNVRHVGVMVAVDEILLEVGESIGYEPLPSWVARLRGNSAQQMGRFGREPARESIVMLRKP
jgi:tRNA G10  N-methylase Trm11